MNNFAWQDFHFLRPWWLLAAIPALWLVWRLARSRARAGAWENVIDAHLLSHLLRSNAAPMISRSSKSNAMYRLLGVAGVLAVLALAGPTGSKSPQPVYRAQATHIVVLSLAPTMDAPDVAPSRVARARLKVLDLLARQREGQVALIAYSAEPYVVSPLTEDAKTVAALVPVLTTDLMPASGDNLGAALTKAGELLTHAGASHGEVIVVTDGVRDAILARGAAAQLRADGHRVSVLAVGTPDGAPVPSAGGKFLHDAAGAIVIPKLELAPLQQVAAVGGGRTATLSVNDADLTHLLDWEPTTRSTDQARRLDRKSNQGLARWRDEGPWLVLLLLLPVMLLFRRGWLVVIVVAILSAQADQAYALDTSNLWLRKDQQAQRAMSAEDFPRAVELFDDPARKGAALYRAQRFTEAAQAFSQVNSGEGFYNRGNALAKAGQLNEALAAYNEALKLTPAHQDAAFNKALVEKLIKDSPQQKSQSPNQAEQQQTQPSSEQKNAAGQQQPANGQQGADRAEPAKGENAPDDKQTKSAKQSQESSKAGDQEQAAADSRKSQDAQSQAGSPQSGKRTEPMTNDEQRESSQVLEQWLGQVVDDPGGLLREKFRRQHLRRLKSGARE